MSVVSSMIVSCGLMEDDALTALNEWCARQSRVVEFRPLDLNVAGGGKAMQVDIYAAAGNYYNHCALADAFSTFPWVFPAEAVLVAYPEDGPPIIVRGDGKAQALHPDRRGVIMYRPTHNRAGSNSERQSVGDPGHCDRCAKVGHVRAHPDLGCGDVGCYAEHAPGDPGDL